MFLFAVRERQRYCSRSTALLFVFDNVVVRERQIDCRYTKVQWEMDFVNPEESEQEQSFSRRAFLLFLTQTPQAYAEARERSYRV